MFTLDGAISRHSTSLCVIIFRTKNTVLYTPLYVCLHAHASSSSVALNLCIALLLYTLKIAETDDDDDVNDRGPVAPFN